MANNVEEFLIEFGFEGTEALKKMGRFFKKVEKAEKKKSATIREQNKLLAAQNGLRSKINQAEKLGLDSNFYKRSLASSKKSETLDTRRLELTKLIQVEQNKLQKDSIKNAESARKLKELKQAQLEETKKLASEEKKAAKDKKDSEKESIKNAKELAKLREKSQRDSLRQAKMLQSVEGKVARFSESRNVSLLRGKDPASASRIEKQFRSAVTDKDVRTVARLNRQVAEVAANYRRAARNADLLKTTQMGVADSTRNMVRSYASLFALIEGTASINRVGQDFETMRAGMLAASNGAELAGKDLAFVDQQSVRLGLNLRQTAKDFVKLRAVNKDFTDDQLKETFLGIAEASTILGLSTDDTAGALRA